MESEVGGYSASCLLRLVEDGFMWAFLGVYGPISHNTRGYFWEEMEMVAPL